MVKSFPILVCKARRIVRGTFPAAVKEFQLDVWGRGRAFDAALALAVTYIGLSTASIPELVATADNWILFLQAFFYVACGWAVLCLARAPISIIRDDRHAAKWIGHHRIYHEPKLIATERLTDTNGETHRILMRFPDVDPEAFVRLKFDCSPQMLTGRILLTVIPGPPILDMVVFNAKAANEFTGFVGPNALLGCRISKEKTATLYVRLEPGTTPVTMRVYCGEYFVGGNDDKP